MTSDPLFNPFKAALRCGRQQVGLWCALAEAYPAELCAAAGYDWLLLDAEHGPNDPRSILAQLQAIAGYGAHPVVRPPSTAPDFIRSILDMGVQTLLIPQVETVGQVQSLIQLTRYPPEGKRGVGAGLARAARWGGVDGYLSRADAQMALLIQIESARGLAALDEIASLPEVDGIFLGAADLAADMGYPGNADAPAVRDAIGRALARLRERNMPDGVLCTGPVPDLLAQCRFIAIGTDCGLLAGGARHLRATFAARRHD